MSKMFVLFLDFLFPRVVEKRVENVLRYAIYAKGDRFRLTLIVGELKYPELQHAKVRNISVILTQDVASLEEAHQIIESERERYKQARVSGHPLFLVNQK